MINFNLRAVLRSAMESSLLERMSVPDNRMRLPYPPVQEVTTIGYEEVEVRYREEERTVNVYKYSYDTVERMVPKRTVTATLQDTKRKK